MEAVQELPRGVQELGLDDETKRLFPYESATYIYQVGSE